MPETPKGFPFPLGTDPNDVPLDMEALANAINAMPGVPSLTTSQRNALTSDQRPPVIYNTSATRLEYHDGAGWKGIPSTDDLALKADAVHTHSQYIPLTQKGANNGVAPLNSAGKVPADHLPEASQPQLPTGSIIPFTGATAPDGFLLCQGQLVSKTTFADLYAVMGDAYGSGDGSNFRLPDMRERFPRGKPSGESLGATGGSDSHGHSASGSSGSAGTHGHGGSTGSAGSHSHGGSTGAGGGGTNVRATDAQVTVSATNHSHSISSDGSHSHSISAEGGHSHSISVSVNNSDHKPKFVNLNYLIKT